MPIIKQSIKDFFPRGVWEELNKKEKNFLIDFFKEETLKDGDTHILFTGNFNKKVFIKILKEIMLKRQKNNIKETKTMLVNNFFISNKQQLIGTTGTRKTKKEMINFV